MHPRGGSSSPGQNKLNWSAKNKTNNQNKQSKQNLQKPSSSTPTLASLLKDFPKPQPIRNGLAAGMPNKW
jgi:hypothetical protein